MNHSAENLRRLMARLDLTLEQVVECSGLDERTVKAIAHGTTTPHPRTLHKLAAGLDVSTDELFQDPSLLAYRSFDRETNPLVDQVVSDYPSLFAGWSQSDFDELYSRFGDGGAVTTQGAVTMIEAMNQKREVHNKVALVLESSEGDLLVDFVELLYQRVAARE
jgi:transcriptional regulator with XRE-family HTH domain